MQVLIFYELGLTACLVLLYLYLYAIVIICIYILKSEASVCARI